MFCEYRYIENCELCDGPTEPQCHRTNAIGDPACEIMSFSPSTGSKKRIRLYVKRPFSPLGAKQRPRAMR